MDPKSFASDAPGSLQHDPAGYWTFHPYPLPPLFRWTDELAGALSAADRALGRLAARLDAAPQAIYELVARAEAAASCRMAGLESDFIELLAAEAGYLEPFGAHGGEAQAGAYAQTLLAAAVVHPGEALDLGEVESIHAELLPFAPEEGQPSGVFRNGQTWIGPPGSTPEDAVFVPPPPEVMRTSLQSLVDFTNRPGRLPAVLRLGLVHYQFEVIHPFYEANGRTGRLLNASLLTRFDLLPGPGAAVSLFLLEKQADYDRRLERVSRKNEFGDWLRFFLEGIVAACAWSERLLDAHAAIRAECLARVADERTAARLAEAIDFALTRPYFNVGQLEAALPGGNFKSAARLVDRLVRLELVEETTGQARHRVFRLVEWAEQLAGMG